MRRSISDWGGNILALVVVIVVNWMANALPLFGISTGAVSDKYYSMFTPAGFTFAIWGLIYLLLTGFIIYQALPSKRDSQVLARIGPWFKGSCAANTLWMFAWHLEWLMVTLLLMIVLLVTLVAVYRALSDEPWYVLLPFSVYTGWITVATIANVSAMETALGWNAVIYRDVLGTLAKLAFAGAVVAVVSVKRLDVFYTLTIGWAAYGIAVGQKAVPPVAGAATSLMVLALLLAVYVLYCRFSEIYLRK